MAKQQFVQQQPSQNKQPSEAPTSDATEHAASSQEELFPSSTLHPKKSGNGLLSSWKASSPLEMSGEKPPSSINNHQPLSKTPQMLPKPISIGQGFVGHAPSVQTPAEQPLHAPSPNPLNANPASSSYYGSQSPSYYETQPPSTTSTQSPIANSYRQEDGQVTPNYYHNGAPLKPTPNTNPSNIPASNNYYSQSGTLNPPGTQGNTSLSNQTNYYSQSGTLNPTSIPAKASNTNLPNPANYYHAVSNPGAANPLRQPDYPQVAPGNPLPGHTGKPAFRDSSPPMPPMPPPPNERRIAFKQPKKRRFPIWARVLVALLVVLIVGGGASAAYYQINYADAINNITGHQAIHHIQTQTRDSNGNVQNQTASTDILSGQRVNILLLGSDNDGKGNNGVNGSPLAQTDIVITIDPQGHYVGMLSIPRDLQVTIPGHGAGKMDFAFSFGFQDARSKDFDKSISSAAGLAEDTIAYNFGIHIDYYAWVGLSGFVKVIEVAGGVDVDVIHPMVDDNYPDDINKSGNAVYDYKRIYIGSGPQHLNGVQALEYVRTRHSDLVGDFGRSARQQQVLNQLKTKLATPETIAKAPDLLNAMSGAVKTDLKLQQMVEMGNFARGIDSNKIDRITLGPPTFATALPGNTGNFAPICTQVRSQIAKMFAIQPKCLPQYSAIADTNAAGFASIALPSNTKSMHVAISTPVQSALALTTSIQSMAIVPSNSTHLLHNPTDFTGVHSILDLMFMNVFESFDAFKA